MVKINPKKNNEECANEEPKVLLESYDHFKKLKKVIQYVDRATATFMLK
jgi:hypothetical protein